MFQVKRTSSEGKVLDMLMEKHPMDFERLLKETGFRRDRLELVLKRLLDKKIILVHCYPERYITLLRKDFEFTGMRRQHKTIKMDRKAEKHQPSESKGYG